VNIQVRKATEMDVPHLSEVIEASVRGLQARDYSPAQIEGALQSVYGVDSQLIADGTYLVAEVSIPIERSRKSWLVAGGASARRSTAAINTWDVKIHCWIPRVMQRRFERFLCVRNGRGVASAD